MAVTRNRLSVHLWTLIVGFLFLPILPNYALAAEIHVPSQIATIQGAIDAAQDGDKIVVQPGNYKENINFKGKAVLLTSTNPLDPAIVAGTIIDGDTQGSVVTFNSGETASSILTGFTIRNGSGTLRKGKRYGGGIYCGVRSAPTIRHNKIVNNTADIGGAIYVEGNSPPSIAEGPDTDYPYVGIGKTVGLSVKAADRDGDPLIYTWNSKEGGTITGTGDTVLFSATTAGVYAIEVTVNDQYGGTVNGTVTVTVIGISIRTPLPQLLVGQGATLSAALTPAIGDSPQFPVNVTWSVLEGPAAGLFDPAVNGNPSATSIIFTPSASGPGRIQAEYKVGSAGTTASIGIALSPVVVTIAPASAIQGTTVQATIQGHNLGRVNAVALGGEGINGTIKEGGTEDSLPVQLIISQNAEPGNRTIILTTPEGQFNTLVTFQIKPLPAVVADPANLNLVVGDTRVITFSIPDPAPAGGLGLILSSSAPIVASIPASATIPEGQKSVAVTIMAVGYGTTTITANTVGYSKAQVPVTVINPPLITFLPSPLNVAVGLVEKCTINISNPAPAGGLLVNLSGGEGKVERPATVTIPEFSTSATFNAKGLAEGTATIAATATGYPVANLQVNIATGQFNLFPSYLPIAAGRSSTLLLSIPNAAPSGGLTVNIASNNTAFVTTPSAVTIPENERSVSVPVNGVGVGSTTVTANLTGFRSAQATVNVLQAYNISFVPNSLTITPATSQTTDVAVSSPAPDGGLVITLSNPSQDKVSVPNSVVILEGQFKNTISVSGLDTTSSPVIINASCPGLTDGQLSVIVHPKYQPWIKADVTVGVGTRTSGAVGLTGATAPAGGYTVNLVSNDPTIAAVPATVTIPQGQSWTSFTIVGKAVGATDITASVSGFTATSGPVTVVKPTFEWVSVPTQMTLGATQSVYVQTYVPNGSYYSSSYKYGSTNQTVDQALTVSLSSENPAVLQVPATAMIAAGDNYTSFNVQAVAMGTSTLTASATGWGNGTSETITVVAPQLWIKADVTVGAGTQTTGVVGLTDEEASAGGYTINLASSDPSIATVPATVTIPEEEIGATFVITGKALGTADITASVAQVTVASAVTVVKPTFEWSQVPTETITGATSNVEIGTYVPGGSYYDYYYWDTYKYFDSAQPVGQTLTVSLSTEDPAVIQVPATTTITPGNNYGSFEIQAVVTGTSALTASAPGWDSKTSERITVVGPQLWIKADVTVGTGTRTTGAVGLTDAWAPSGGYTINLTSSDPSIASVPSTVTIPYGAGGTIFTIIGNAVGNTEVIASVPGSTATSGPVAVVKSRLEWNYVPMEMTVGTLDVSLVTYVPGGSSYYYYDYWGAYKYFSPPQPLDQTTTVSLSSDDPAVIQVPSTATIEAGSTYTTPPDIQAVGIGTSRLTASAPGWDSSTTEAITVTAALAGLWIRANVVAGAGMQTTGAVGFAGPDAPAGEYTINLTNSGPSIVSAPESVTIREGYSSAMFTIVGKAGGAADITASVADHTATSSVTVVTPTFEWEDVPTEMVLYDSVETRVRTYVPNGSYSYYSNGGIYKYPYPNQNVDRTVTVSLSSENPAVLQVPATAMIAAGDNYTSFNVQAVETGTSTLTASAPDWDSATTGTITVK